MEPERYTVQAARPEQVEPALALAWRVFYEFEAPVYEPEGVRTFAEFIRPDGIRAHMEQGMRMWVCCAEDEVAGMLATRPPCHLSLLFVDKAHHRQGIARRLFEAMCGYWRAEGLPPDTLVTVNSSPYAVPVYRRLGFVETSPERQEDGIRYTPMQRPLG